MNSLYLETLSVGWHTLKVIFTGGEASTTFQVLAASGGTLGTGSSGTTSSTGRPCTGDENNLMLWAAMGILAGLASAACGFSAKRRKRSR